MLELTDLYTLDYLRNKIENLEKIFDDYGFLFRKGTSGDEYFGNCPLCFKENGFHFTKPNLKFSCAKCYNSGSIIDFISIKNGEIYNIEANLLLFTQKYCIKQNLPLGKYKNSNDQTILVNDIIRNELTGEWNVLYWTLDDYLLLQFVPLIYFIAPVKWSNNTNNRYILYQEVDSAITDIESK